MSAAAIARKLGVTRRGQNWRIPCPCECGYTLRFCDGEDGRLLAICDGGCDFNEIATALVPFDDDDGEILVTPSVIVCQRDDAKCIVQRIADARRICDICGWDERLRIYLGSRYLYQIPPILRFTEQAPHRLGARLPAMLAPIVDVDGVQTGVHMTYLRRDGSGKADLPKEYQRECRGVIKGGSIRLTEFDPNAAWHIIGEGIESTLSAMEIFGLPGWAAVSAGGLKTVELPPAMRRVLIAADNDVSGTGQRNAEAAYDRWTAEGRTVRIRRPRNVGDDFNDVLIKMRGGDVRH
jgi:hypothetical protein